VILLLFRLILLARLLWFKGLAYAHSRFGRWHINRAMHALAVFKEIRRRALGGMP
jgi:hypothetical protein